MALLEQWRSNRSWAIDGVMALGGAALGITGLIPAILPPVAEGIISSPNKHPWEHPVRAEILSTLDKSPGIHFRELQRRMNAANGTLRHHLDVLVNEKNCDYYSSKWKNLLLCWSTGANRGIDWYWR